MNKTRDTIDKCMWLYYNCNMKGVFNMAIIQFRVDDELKLQASLVYEKLGMDLSTAIRIFLKRSVVANGIPFSMVLDDDDYNSFKARQAIKNMQRISLENGNSDMTLDEINEEIKLSRLERKQKCDITQQ